MGPIWNKGLVDWPLGPAAPCPKGPMRARSKSPRGGAGRPPNPNPRAASLGAKPPVAAGPRRGMGHTPLASYIRRGRGGGAAPLSSTPRCPSAHPPTLAAPPPPPPPPQTLGEALSDLHHTHHATVVVLLISRASPPTLAGSRTWSLHRAVRVDLSEVLLVRRLDNTSPRD